ncbi:MAG: MFS transporter [Nitrospirae bacterium]|nr:MFS transporter [Nitrospirota bacterium]
MPSNGGFPSAPLASEVDPGQTPWWKDVTRYQWLILFVAWLGWVFDSMDSTLYAMVLQPALHELLGSHYSKESMEWYGGIIFSTFLIGWALGGVLFGILADTIGRTKTLIFTILIYSLFTGLAALSQNWWHLMIYRFITALGIGGEWAAGASLVAEIWPESKRAKAAGILQSAWAAGFFLAALASLLFGAYGWRILFVVGILPALVTLLIRFMVKEPEKWLRANETRRAILTERPEYEKELLAFSLTRLFNRKLRWHTLAGSILAFVAVFGLWGATNWTPTLIRELLASENLNQEAVNRYVSYAVMCLNGGALAGYLAFGPIADRFGRRPAFFFMCLGSLIMIPVTFLIPRDYAILLWLLPVLGFFTNGIFSGFPIYLPELYPTSIRATGVGFCFNIGRVLASAGPFVKGYLGTLFSPGKAVSLIGLVYLLGMVTLLFAPETKGKPLPD